MILEAILMLTVGLTGLALLAASGVSGPILAPLGFLVGTGAYIAVGSLQIVAGVSTSPLWTIGATAATGLVVGAVARWKGRWKSGFMVPLVTALIILLSVWAFRTLNFIGWHSDSIRYLLSGSLIGVDETEHMTISLWVTRVAAYPLFVAPARIIGESFFRSFSPLVALSTCANLAWFVCISLRSSALSRTQRRWSALAVVLLLATNHRFVWNGFYVNSHLLFAASMLLVVGAGWLRIHRRLLVGAPVILLQSAGVTVLALARPEGPLITAAAVLPFVCSTQLTKLERTIPLVVLGAVTLTWYSWVASLAVSAEKPVQFSVTAMMALGIAAMAAAPLAVWPRLSPVVRHVLPAVELLLWLALFAFTLRNPDILTDSVAATIDNIARDKASWGSSLLILMSIVVGLLLFTTQLERQVLRYSLTTFIPLAFLLAYLRDHAYRDGDRDSLVRMFIHVVPVAVLFIGCSLGAEWRFSKRPINT